MDARNEGGEIGECFFDCFAVPEVVFPAVQNDPYGLVAGEELVEVVKDLMELGAPEAPVENRGFRKVFGQRIPTTDGGTAGEKGEVFRRGRIDLVHFGECFEILCEPLRIRLGG